MPWGPWTLTQLLSPLRSNRGGSTGKSGWTASIGPGAPQVCTCLCLSPAPASQGLCGARSPVHQQRGLHVSVPPPHQLRRACVGPGVRFSSSEGCMSLSLPRTSFAGSVWGQESGSPAARAVALWLLLWIVGLLAPTPQQGTPPLPLQALPNTLTGRKDII